MCLFFIQEVCKACLCENAEQRNTERHAESSVVQTRQSSVWSGPRPHSRVSALCFITPTSDQGLD